MIFDAIENSKNYTQLKDISKALSVLANITRDNFPKEKIIINGDYIFANPVTLTSRPAKDCIFEAHNKYIDIHYIVSGVEGISVCNRKDLIPTGVFNTYDDIGFFRGSPKCTIYLHPGEFMVCWPEDAHRVGIMKNLPCNIMKIVAKVRI